MSLRDLWSEDPGWEGVKPLLWNNLNRPERLFAQGCLQDVLLFTHRCFEICVVEKRWDLPAHLRLPSRVYFYSKHLVLKEFNDEKKIRASHVSRSRSVSLVVLLALCSSSLNPAPTRTRFVSLESNIQWWAYLIKHYCSFHTKLLFCCFPVTEARKTLCLDIV